MTVHAEEQHINMEDVKPESGLWKKFINILELDDQQKLEALIREKCFDNVWRPRDSEQKQTSLHKAAELGSILCMKVLIETAKSNAESVDSPDIDGFSPLFIAVKQGKVESIRELLNSDANINARNDQGHSVLHVLAYEISKSVNNHSLSCLDVVLENSAIDLEAHNKYGYTPLLAAANKMQSIEGARKSNMILFCRKLISKGASFEVCDKKGNTVKQILESHNAFPSIPFCNPPRRPLISQLHDSLLLGLDAEIVKALLRGEESKLVKRVVNSYIGSETVLYHVVDKGNLQCVEILLNAGADAGTKMLSGQSCLNVALFRGEPEILELLIDNMKKNQSKLDLRDQSFGLLESLLENYKKISKDRESDNFKCLKRILADDIILNVNAVTKGRVQQSILHVAASYNNQEALMLLLEKGSFLGSTKVVDGEDQGNIFGALRPETLVQAMDGCISHLPSGNDSEGTENILSSDYSLNLNYEFLVPYSVTDTKENNEVKTLVKISQNEHHKKAIKHPLIQAFIYAKWCKVYGLYITNLLLYLAFVIFLTLFMYGMKDLRILEERASKLSSANETIQMEIEKTSTYVSIWMWLLIPVTLYMLVREVFQILYTFRVYLKNIENYLEILLIVFVIIFCSAKLSIDATRHLAAWSMIIAWLEFILLLGRDPPLAIYITMFRHVSWNFLKLIFLYGALLLAFTVSFNIILQPVLKTDEPESSFNNFWSTLPRAIVMATGEFEYSDLSVGFFSSNVMFAISATLIFLVFLFLIFLVLMNVMNGLAVTDTQQVMEEATVYSLKSRLQLIYLIEEMFMLVPFFNRFASSRIHLIFGKEKPQMTVRVNMLDKSKRVVYGEKEFCHLDNRTADILRSHRLEAITQEDQMTRCQNLFSEIRDLIVQNPRLMATPPTLSPSSSRARLS